MVGGTGLRFGFSHPGCARILVHVSRNGKLFLAHRPRGVGWVGPHLSSPQTRAQCGASRWQRGRLSWKLHPSLSPGPRGERGQRGLWRAASPGPGLRMFLEGLRTQFFTQNHPTSPGRQPSPCCKKTPWRASTRLRSALAALWDPRNGGCVLASFVQKAEGTLEVLGGLEYGVQSPGSACLLYPVAPGGLTVGSGGCGIPVGVGEPRSDWGVFPQAPMTRTPHVR